jgi:transposase InsO family protein
VPDRCAETVMDVLRVVFSRNGLPRTLVSDNAAEIGDADLCDWLRRIGCKLVKTPPFHSELNSAAERMVQTVKHGLKAFMKERSSFNAYLARLLLSCRSIPHADRGQIP